MNLGRMLFFTISNISKDWPDFSFYFSVEGIQMLALMENVEVEHLETLIDVLTAESPWLCLRCAFQLSHLSTCPSSCTVKGS